MDKTYDSGKFELGAWTRRLALAGLERLRRARAPSRSKRGALRGRGMAAFLEWTGADVFEERVTVTVDRRRRIEIFSATQAAWDRGSLTTFAQLAVDVFGVPIEKIRIVQGDTDRGHGLRQRRVALALRRRIRRCRSAPSAPSSNAQGLAAEELEAAAGDIEYRDGVFSIAGTDRRIGSFELARRQPQRRIVLDSTSTVAGPTWPNGCHICEVEVDPDTGAVEIVGYWSVNDVGRVVNPMIVIGQLEGGAAQGIGQALCESFVYDRESGQALIGELSRLRAAARGDDRAFRDDDGRVDAVPEQRDGRQRRRRARHDRRHAGGGQRGDGRARTRRSRRDDQAHEGAADAVDARARVARDPRLARMSCPTAL